MRKHEGIDIMKLYSQGNQTSWNKMLTRCFDNQDINTLAKIKYQLSVGMDDLAKLKLNSDDINVQFVRWVRSLEITAKRIIKKKHPMPGDNLSLSNLQNDDPSFKLKALTAKRKRDEELREFLRKSSY
jgi:hypothetical protein